MRDGDLELVRSLPLFSSMRLETFERLGSTSFLQKFPSGVQLINEGDPADFLHVVIDGSVELFASNGRRQTTIAILEPVAAFILAAVVKDAFHLMSARTLQPSRVLMIPAPVLRAAMEQDSALSGAMVRELARGFRILVKTVKNQKLRTASERLANHLLMLHGLQGGKGKVTLHHEKRLLASLLGVTPENLSRAFKTLRPYGVGVNGTTIILERLDDLRSYAKPNALIDDQEEW